MKWIYPMSRYTIQVETGEPKEFFSDGQVAHGDDYFDVIYGFDANDGYFLQAWLIAECGFKDLTYHEKGDKSAITESPFWSEIQAHNQDHAMKIALDLPF